MPIHIAERHDHEQASYIRQTPAINPNFSSSSATGRSNDPSKKTNARGVPDFMEVDIGLKECEQNGKQRKSIM